MSDIIDITTTALEEVVEITTTDNQTVVNVINQTGGSLSATLQDITDNGYETSNPIISTQGFSAPLFLATDGTSFIEIRAEDLILTFSNGSFVCALSCNEMNANYSWTLPNKSGVVALISDLADVATSGSYNDLTDTPTIPDTPNIGQVLNVSDRPVILHDVTSGDFTFDTTHIGKYIGFYGVGVCNAIIPDDTYDGTKWVNLVGAVGQGAYINLVRTGGTQSTIIGHEKRIVTFGAKLTDPPYNGWVIDAEPVSQFEIQLTQVGTNAPDIVTDSIIGAMGANISTTYNSDGEYYIVADLPIFANVKDYIKNSASQKIDFYTVYSGLNTFGATVRYKDDYTLQVNTFNYTDFFSVYLSNDIMGEPTLIQIPFKP